MKPILIVEDSKFIADYYRTLFRDSVIASNGREFIFHINCGRWRLILSDIMIPGGPSTDIMKDHIRELGDTPIVLCSGIGFQKLCEFYEDLLANGLNCRGVLHKPSGAKKLKTFVELAEKNV